MTRAGSRPPSGRNTPRAGGERTTPRRTPQSTPRGAVSGPSSHPVDGAEDETCVRVALRARPLVPKERMEGARMCVTADSANSRVVLGNNRTFTFDYVFGPTSTQGEVFDECVGPLLDGCYSGYNATILAYGQTGSGKTYTMGTGNNAAATSEDLGIVPRLIKKLFETIEGKSSESQFVVRCQYLEVYNEAIRDLLHPDTPSSALQIREAPSGEITVSAAHEEPVTSYFDCIRLLDIGSLSRATGDTDMNEQSSRSHAIFSIFLEQQALGSAGRKGEVTISKLHLVDLAGSERVKKSHVVGDRFKEAVTINQGLLALGNVISALGDEQRRATHVPYRDSKITRMLQDSLGGNSRTLMVATISTADSCIEESLNTLKYANRARNIRNKPIVNKGMRSDLEAVDAEIRAMQLELLRHQLHQPGGNVFAGVEITEEDRKQLIHVLGGTVASEVETASLVNKIGIMQEELSAAQENLRAADEAGTATARAIERLSKENSGMRSMIAALQSKIDQVVEISNDGYSLDQITDALRDRILEVCTNDNSAQRLSKSTTLQSPLTGSPQHRSMQAVNGHDLHYMEQINEQHSVIEKLRAAREASALAEQRAVRAEAALQEATDDLARDEIIFAEKLAEMTAVQQHASDMQIRNAELEAMLSEAFEELEQLRCKVERQSLSEAVSPTQESHEDASFASAQEAATQDDELRATEISQAMGSAPIGAVERLFAAAALEEEDMVLIGADQSLNEYDSDTSGTVELLKHQAVQAKAEEMEIVSRQFVTTKNSLEVQLRELEHNIQQKEELIEQLLHNEAEQKRLSAAYEQRLAELEQEVAEQESKVNELRTMITELDTDRVRSVEDKQKLREEYEDRLKQMEHQLGLAKRQRKDQDAMKVEKERARAKVRVTTLEKEVDSMRQAQEVLRKKVKEAAKEHDLKVQALKKEQAILRRDLEESQRRVRQLEADNERQRGLVRKKVEEAARHAKEVKDARGRTPESTPPPTARSVNSAVAAAELTRMKAVLDKQMRLVAAKKEAEQKLAVVQGKKASLEAEKSKVAQARNQLELRRMRAQQAISKHVSEMALAIQELEEELSMLHQQPTSNNDRTAAEIVALEEQLASAVERKAQLQAKLESQDFLSPEDHAAARDLDDAVDTLDAELEYLADEGSAASNIIAEGTRAAETFQKQLRDLAPADARAMLAQYMETLVTGRDRERQNAAKVAELEVRCAESKKEVEDALYRLRMKEVEYDRRLTELQQDHAGKVSALLKQANAVNPSGDKAKSGMDGQAAGSALAQSSDGLQALNGAELRRLVKFFKEQMELLNKDNFYYKKLNRELKRKLRAELGASIASSTLAESRQSISRSQQSLAAAGEYDSAGSQRVEDELGQPPAHLRASNASRFLSPIGDDEDSDGFPGFHSASYQSSRHGDHNDDSDAGTTTPEPHRATDTSAEQPGHRHATPEAPLSRSRARLKADLDNYKSRMRGSSGSGSTRWLSDTSTSNGNNR